MIKKLLVKDLQDSKLSSGAIFVFVLITCLLFSTIGIVGLNLSDSIDRFFEKAKTPDYVQMHLGDLDYKRLENFSKENPAIKEMEVMKFLNIDNGDIYINGQRFIDNYQDNGFSSQSQNFDYLLDIDGNIVQPMPGQVYVPITYMEEGLVSVGDILQVGDLKLEVKGPIRDSQMNSPLSSSKRFLINEEDYQKIYTLGQEEFLLEFIFNEGLSSSEFQGFYEGQGLEANGPSISKDLIKLVNAISDGIILAILFLLGLILLILNFLAIRFTVLSKIEEDYDIIATFKCMGMRNKDIRLVYLGKYLIICLLAGIIAFVFSIFLSKGLRSRIEKFIGPSTLTYEGYMLGAFLILLISLIILLYISRILSRIEKLTPLDAKRLGELGSSRQKTTYKLRNTRLGVNPYFGIKNLVYNKRLYLSFGLVLVTAILIMILPQGIYNTVSSDSFLSYMGVGQADLIISMDEPDLDLEEKLTKDKNIDSYNKLINKKYDIKLANGLETKLWTLEGEHEDIAYIQGTSPQGPNEIALSSLALDELELDIGDSFYIISDQKDQKFQVVGEYSDITNGGITGRLKEIDGDQELLSVNYNIKSQTPDQVIYHYRSDELSIISVYDFRDQVLGPTISSLKSLSLTSLIIAVLLIFFIGILFNNLIFNIDKRKNAIEHFLGYYLSDIKSQYSITNIILVILVLLISIVIALAFGNLIIALLFSSVGISNLDIKLDLFYSLLFVPILTLIVIYISMELSSRRIQDINDINILKG